MFRMTLILWALIHTANEFAHVVISLNAKKKQIIVNNKPVLNSSTSNQIRRLL